MNHGTRRQFLRHGVVVGSLGLVVATGCSVFSRSGPSASKTRRVARLYGSLATAAADGDTSAAFRQGLADLGYLEGENLVIEVAELSEAVEVVQRQPEVIVVTGVSDARSMHAATTSIPIVSVGAGDLVAGGLAASLARPGGNVTGLTTPEPVSKQLQLLQEAVPSLTRVAVVIDSTLTDIRGEPIEAAGRALGLQVQIMGVNDADELVSRFDTLARDGVNGLYVSSGRIITGNQARIAELALQRKLPSVWVQSDAVTRGGLMGYGPNRADLSRRAATYVDKILKGANPGDLPIEQPTPFDFAINLKSAAALGITIPHSVLAQATEVIQ
ncbi:MAG: ABC transporter substrate-binding protein [Chloroflexota bacterium]